MSDQTPIYFISPIAKQALAHAQIYPECLSEVKQNKASNPEFPFAHDDAIETGRLKVYEYPSSGLSNTFKGPAVIFAGHPTLELGQGSSWARDWCKSGTERRNKIIVTEPGLPINLFSDHDRKHVIHYLPIDTRYIICNYYRVTLQLMLQLRMTSSATKILIEDLKPKELVISQDLLSNHPKLREGILVPNVLGPGKSYKSTNTTSYKYVNVRNVTRAYA